MELDGFKFDNLQSGLVIARSEPPIVLPTTEQIGEYTSKVDNSARFGSVELAAAMANPKAFLSRIVLSTIGSEITPDQARLVTTLRGYSTEGIVIDDLVRPIEDDINSKFQRTTPGSLEIVSIEVAKLLSEQQLVGDISHVVIDPLVELHDYARKCTYLPKLPEMPDLIITILERVDLLGNLHSARFKLYGLLEGMGIPDSLKEELLIKMDAFSDLDHPLAYSLTLELMESCGESSGWIKNQKRRRNELVGKLDGNGQDLFDKYKDLKELSRGLVTGIDYSDMQEGKVGLELEMKAHIEWVKRLHQRVVSEESEYGLRHPDIGDGWAVHSISDQGRNLYEITRQNDSLEWNGDYLKAVGALYQGLKNNTADIGALHYHLDRETHPYLPDLSGLFFGRNNGKSLVSKRFYTWDVRFLDVPRHEGNIHPGRVVDAIQFLIGVAKDMNDQQVGEIIHGDTDAFFTQDQIVFGYLSSIFPDPQVRLNALMMLHDSAFFKGINSLVLNDVFDEHILKKHFISELGDNPLLVGLLDVNMEEMLEKKGISYAEFLSYVVEFGKNLNFSSVDEAIYISQLTEIVSSFSRSNIDVEPLMKTVLDSLRKLDYEEQNLFRIKLVKTLISAGMIDRAQEVFQEIFFIPGQADEMASLVKSLISAKIDHSNIINRADEGVLGYRIVDIVVAAKIYSAAGLSTSRFVDLIIRKLGNSQGISSIVRRLIIAVELSRVGIDAKEIIDDVRESINACRFGELAHATVIGFLDIGEFEVAKGLFKDMRGVDAAQLLNNYIDNLIWLGEVEKADELFTLTKDYFAGINDPAFYSLVFKFPNNPELIKELFSKIRNPSHKLSAIKVIVNKYPNYIVDPEELARIIELSSTFKKRFRQNDRDPVKNGFWILVNLGYIDEGCNLIERFRRESRSELASDLIKELLVTKKPEVAKKMLPYLTEPRDRLTSMGNFLTYCLGGIGGT